MQTHIKQLKSRFAETRQTAQHNANKTDSTTQNKQDRQHNTTQTIQIAQHKTNKTDSTTQRKQYR